MRDVRTRVRAARTAEKIATLVTGGAAAFVVMTVVFIVGYIVYRGAASISWEFLTASPRESMTAGGIWPAIVGTVMLVTLTAVFALPVGVLAGVYLSEFASRGRLTRVIRIAIANMAGVPSIVYGLFGYALFRISLGLGVSALSGALTLACMTLPVVITSTEEALRQVPRDLRQAALALGSSRLGTVFRVVLPAAAPGILTGSILGLSRAAGETAPILVTAVAFSAPIATNVLDPTMALPYHLYILATQSTQDVDHVVWGTALVLVAGVSIINVAAAAWRSRQRSKIKW